MFCHISSMGIIGIDAYPVEVETDCRRGMPQFEIVGLPDAAVRESRDRVRAALGNCGFSLPDGRIVINLAPADVRKAGAVYDLPIFVGLLCATEQISVDAEGMVLLGELSLSGQLRPVHGVLPMTLEAKKRGFRSVFVPAENAAEGAAVSGIGIYPVRTVQELLDHLTGRNPIAPARFLPFQPAPDEGCPDFSDVKGQAMARRAAEIAAAGGHNLLLIGAPGTGKSMIAKRIPSILPPLTFEEALETSIVHSVAGALPAGEPLIRTRPFRSPHHTVSPAGLAGGGGTPRPGEVSLAHNGVLFLDELPEFSRNAMEVLRQPVEDGQVTISRANWRVSYPSRVMLVAAMNPCPCGYYGHPARKCICGEHKVARYIGRVSGPLLDRIDLHVEVLPVEFEQLSLLEKSESSAEIRKRVTAARQRQLRRMEAAGASCNAQIAPGMVNETCPMTEEAKRLLRYAFDSLGLSARAYDRVLKVARTIADLDGADVIDRGHIAEAVQYRSLDRKYWGA